eukprot:TRINITY_DN2460_c0_g3_i1.p1 TRINITY_DN2460_c0_g3~~TRINITY_DN2460_c0_g3_i1.p1  ORF type:complete len:371 (+),score=85.36 TRINITY_DN2460_c0_g3_i1:178-1290(+)
MNVIAEQTVESGCPGEQPMPWIGAWARRSLLQMPSAWKEIVPGVVERYTYSMDFGTVIDVRTVDGRLYRLPFSSLQTLCVRKLVDEDESTSEWIKQRLFIKAVLDDQCSASQFLVVEEPIDAQPAHGQEHVRHVKCYVAKRPRFRPATQPVLKARRAVKRMVKSMMKNPMYPVHSFACKNERCVVALAGPVGSPYEGGLFKVIIEFDDVGAFEEPRILTPMYHINVRLNGDFFNFGCYAAAPLILELFVDLMRRPDERPEYCQPNAAEYRDSLALFDRKARDMTAMYAKPQWCHWHPRLFPLLPRGVQQQVLALLMVMHRLSLGLCDDESQLGLPPELLELVFEHLVNDMRLSFLAADVDFVVPDLWRFV